MKIIYYELIKLGKKRIVAALVGLLLVMSCSLYTYEQWQEHSKLISERENYETLEAAFIDLAPEEGWQLTTQMMQDLQFFNLLSSQAIIGEHNPEWKERIDQQKLENPEAVIRYYASQYAADQDLLHRDSLLYEELNRQFRALYVHREYISEMEIRSAEMLSTSIFHKENSFSYHNIQQTVADFKPLESIPLQIGLEYGLVSATQFTPADICLIITLFMIAYYLFHHEREIGLLRLIRSTERGRLVTAGAKLSVMIFSTVLVSLLLYGSLLVIAHYLYGFGDWSRYIQSMSSFKNGIYMLTVGQYLQQYLLFKTLAGLLIGLLIALFFTLFRRPSLVFLILLVCIGSSFFFYTQIHPNSFANALKYMNPVSFLDTFHLIAEYRNINIVGYPISKMLLSCFIIGISIGILLVVTCLTYVLQWSIPFELSFHNQINQVRQWLFQRRLYNLLSQHEWYKLLVSGKGWLILLLTALLTIQMLQVPERSFTLDESVYNQYIQQLEGPLDEVKTNFIETESLRFMQLGVEMQALEESLSSEVITENQYYEQKAELLHFEKKEKSFRLVEQQYYQLLRVQAETGIEPQLVNQITGNELFNKQQRDIRLAMLVLILLSTLFSLLFTQDYRNNAIILLLATKYGRGHLFRRKLWIAYSLTLVLLLLIYSPKYIISLQHYPDLTWNAPIQSIESYSQLQWSVTIGQYVLCTSLLQVFGCLLLVHISQLLSILVRRQTLSLLLQGAVFIIPLALTYLGFDSIVSYTFNGIFLAPFMLTSDNATSIAIFYSGGLLLLCGLAAIMSWKRYNGSVIRRR